MEATVEKLLGVLPPYEDKWVLVHPAQSVRNIISEVLAAHKDFAAYYDSIAPYFEASTVEKICSNLYTFLKNNIQYQEEEEKDQTTSLPTGILVRGHGDCKHYASFTAGVLDALNRRGHNIKWYYRFASYDLFNSQPHHVFVVVNDNGNEIWIDPTPGSGNKSPVWSVDKKVRSMALRRNIAGVGDLGPMQLENRRLPGSGTSELISPIELQNHEEEQYADEVTPELQNAINILLDYGVMNEKGGISDTKLQSLAKKLSVDEFQELAHARLVLTHAITQGVAMGGLFANIWRGIKKATLFGPRNAYLSLVALNIFGFATKLYNAVFKADGNYWQPGQQKLADKWYSLGGDWGHLERAIKSGHHKKAILGNTVGVAAAALPAWVAIAAAIIAAITPLVLGILKERQQASQLDPNINPETGLPYGAPAMNNPSSGFDPMQWIKDNPVLAAAGAVGIYFLVKDDI